MAETPRGRLKFKRFLVNGGPLMPQGYRLATVEEIRKNLDMSKKWELPIKRINPDNEELPEKKRINPSYEERSGVIRLLDGWMPPDLSAAYDKPKYDCIWNAVVKKKNWNTQEKKWQNCSEFYSSDGFSLRKQLYDGIELSPERQKVAWFHAYCYEDVELLYWLWGNYQHFIQPSNFPADCRGQQISMDIPLRVMVRKLETREPTFQPQMNDEINPSRDEAEAVLKDAMDPSRDGAGLSYMYGPTWRLAMVELAIDIYGHAFKNAATSIAFERRESVPIITKFLSLLLPDQLQNQIAELQLPVEELLIEAVKRGYTKLVEHLLDSWNAELPGKLGEEGKKLFYYALPHEPVFSLLYDKYDNYGSSSFDDIIARQDEYGRNVLHWAVKRGYKSGVVDCLLGRLSSRERLIDSKDHQRRTPWHIAASKGDIAVINKLLDHFVTADFPTRINYIQATDCFGQTALQIAASEGHAELVTILIKEGSCPLKERDGQRKTALHHAARVEIPEAALDTCKALVEHPSLSSSKRSLLLWASATGIGTADEMEDVHKTVKEYLQTNKKEYKKDLLREAAINDNVEMAWELLSRGANIEEIRDLEWLNRLQLTEKESVENVLSHMEHIKEQGRDQPSMEDKLGRYVFAQGLAALFLNRFIESPITVGISGGWGMGKSSLMFQTEKILLITAAQLTFPNLLPPEQFGGVQKISPSTSGREIYQQINRGVHKLLDLSKNESKEQNPLVTLLKEYQPRYHDVYKAFACMDNKQMEQEHAFRGVPRILTIQYNAWHYRNEHEAWAGLGVTISKEIEKAMTRAQWMSTCWRYNWAKQRVNIWIQVFLPSLLSIFLAGWVAWIVWMLLKQAKFEGLKYGSIPLTIIAIVWVVLGSVNSVVKPVSTQMLGYVELPDHSSHLGYQEDVINDINFLKGELGKQPHWFFTFILWCWNWFGLYADNVKNTSIPKCMPASGQDIRIVTFVDDLDRCEDKVILQVLSAINLVLAECKINVILGMDKTMIERAITENFNGTGDDLAEKFIHKIIQIPLSLPDPTDQESNSFLEYHLRHKIPAKFHCTNGEKKSVSKSQRSLVVLEAAEAPAGGPQNPPADDTQRGPATPQRPHTVLCIQCDELKQRCRTMLCIQCDKLKRRCRGIFGRTVYVENLNSLRSAEGVRLIREILLPNYTKKEAHLFYELRKFTTGNQKLPREWKCLLSYHKFAWYVLSLIGNVYSLPTWKEELVGWVFVCWQWKREMNHLIQEWNKIAIEPGNGTNRGRFLGPSLAEIVSQLKIIPESNLKEQGISLSILSKLQDALKIQDVSMEGIQLFQQFRLHCGIDHLPWPYG